MIVVFGVAGLAIAAAQIIRMRLDVLRRSDRGERPRTIIEAIGDARRTMGAEGPPPDSYSRVTNPERFAPLHDFVTELADRLGDEFDVERTEAYGIDPELEQHNNSARPTLRLRPKDEAAASITILFTSFPGLYVRFGRWVMDDFPRCGCDACDESIEEEIERLQAEIEGVIAGAFQESISIGDDGAA